MSRESGLYPGILVL